MKEVASMQDTLKESPIRPWHHPGSIGALIGFLMLSAAAASLGSFFRPGEWYASLIKPTWNPPNWIFGPVWTVLYVTMAVSAWLVWRRGSDALRTRALGAYGVQIALNAAWSPLFFGARSPGWALVDILLLNGAIAVTVFLFLRIQRVAGYLLVPYAGWVLFATVLNATLWHLNRG
jgi:benzodiazapine receptor